MAERKKETKVINGVKWERYEGDSFWTRTTKETD